MKKSFKIMATLMAVLSLVMCMAMPIQAAVVDNQIQPQWDNAATLTLSLGFPDYGYAEATIVGKSGVTKIVVDVYVYRQSGSSWIYVTEGHKTINGMYGTFSCQFTPVNGAYYRADYTFTLTKGSVNEVINKTQYRTCEQ